MRHARSGKKLGRDSAHRRALYSNLASALITHGRIETTEAKAKAVRPYAEKMITLGKRGDLHARRLAMAELRSNDVVHKLFSDVAPRFAERNGGYTRVVKLGPRQGDAAVDGVPRARRLRSGRVAAPSGVRLDVGQLPRRPYPPLMLTIAAIVLALTVLPSPWGALAVGLAAAVDVGETAVFVRWSRRRKAVVGVETLVGRTAVVVRPAGAAWPGEARRGGLGGARPGRPRARQRGRRHAGRRPRPRGRARVARAKPGGGTDYRAVASSGISLNGPRSGRSGYSTS